MTPRQKILLHKNLAYSFVYMARANKIMGHVQLYRQYMSYARDHVETGKRAVALVKKYPQVLDAENPIVLEREGDELSCIR